MIWINNSTELIEIPRHSDAEGSRYEIKLINVITKKEYAVEVGTSVSDSALLYKFPTTDFPSMDEGEYEYFLSVYVTVEGLVEKRLIESGLLIYGDYQRDNVPEYQPESNTIVQFNG